jgi:hypothetical protein
MHVAIGFFSKKGFPIICVPCDPVRLSAVCERYRTVAFAFGVFSRGTGRRALCPVSLPGALDAAPC